ncbi:helix-turn-helix domain-containing protein [Pseudonocardia xishanensis]|uniref:HTH tetR-type domain-containing protein n=1 Tax=Pseudonocardia xishanensis TaxID=630995 RepID=A0ABP8RVL5_9PSEU
MSARGFTGGRRTSGPQRTDTRDALLAAAEECFTRFGVARVSMDEVAAAAGVSRPTLYRHFGDRESLVRAIVFARADRLVERVRRVVDAEQGLADKLVAGMLFVVQIGRGDEFIREMLRTGSPQGTNPLMAAHAASDAFAEAVWADTLRPAGVDLPMAYRWLTSVTFMLLDWHDYDELSEEYRRAILHRFLVPAFVRESSP